MFYVVLTNSLVVLALIFLLRSTLIEHLFMSRIRDMMMRRELYLLIDGIDCNECCAFWFSLMVCITNLGLLLPTYGAAVILIYLLHHKEVSDNEADNEES